MLDRPDALTLVHAAFPHSPVVLTLGGTTREMIAVAGRRPNHLYLLDAMGQALPIGLGLALGLADNPRHEKLIVVEGEGSLLMGFSALATVGHLKPRKLVLLVLDNGVYLATGGQPTFAHEIDIANVARSCGWAEAHNVESAPEAFGEALSWARDVEGPVLLRIRVGLQQPKTDYFLEDPVLLARQFETWLHGRG